MASTASNPSPPRPPARAAPAGARRGRGMIAAAAVSSMVVPVAVDGFLGARAHMRNPRWLPHAKLHCAMSFSGGISLGLGALAVLRARPAEDRASMATAAFLATAFWPGLVASGLLPGIAYDFADDPAVHVEPPRVLGKPVHVNVALAAPSTAIGALLRVVDARVPLAFGFALIGAACFMAARLTDAWTGADFLPSQVLQALGQSLGLTSLIWFATRHLDRAEALTFGAFLQTARLLGGELGTAFMQTHVRVGEQAHSFLLGAHVEGGSYLTMVRLQGYAATLAHRSLGPAETEARAVGLLAQAVRRQSSVLAYADGFALLGQVAVAGLLLMLFLRPAPEAAPALPASDKDAIVR